MREYIGERERALESLSLDPGFKEKAQAWIAWAKQYVERIDPLKMGFENLAREESRSEIDQDADAPS